MNGLLAAGVFTAERGTMREEHSQEWLCHKDERSTAPSGKLRVSTSGGATKAEKRRGSQHDQAGPPPCQG
jgi:hypothetical protein